MVREDTMFIDWDGKEERKTPLVAILGGGDWADASVDFLRVPLSVDLQKEYDKYQDYDAHRFDADGNRVKDVPYMSFDEWLIKKAGSEKAGQEYIYVLSDY